MIDTPDVQVRRQVEDALEADRRTRDAVIEVSCLAADVEGGTRLRLGWTL